MTALLKYLMDKEAREATDRAKKEDDRLQFEIKCLELDKELHLQKTRQAACQQLKTWDDHTDPIAYLDKLVLHTDASHEGVGAVLSAERDREQRPLGYYSKRLLPAERNYAATLECLAVFKAIDHFAIHLVGCHFQVVTDHRALTSLLTSNKLNGRLMRWALALQMYHFDVVHRAGTTHQNADGLSRQEWVTESPNITTDPAFGKRGGDVGGTPNIAVGESRSSSDNQRS